MSQHPDLSPLELLKSREWDHGQLPQPLTTPQTGTEFLWQWQRLKLTMQLISLHIYDENISIWTSYLNINGDKEALLGDESSIHGDLYLEIEVLCLKEGSISTP